MTKKDPYQYFRTEARELLDALNQGALALEKSGASKENVTALLRLAHTLKGAARVVRLPEMADLAHAIEDLLAPFREGAEALGRETVDKILKCLDAAGAGLAALDLPAEMAQNESSPAARLHTVRMEVAEVDAVLEGLSEATARLSLLRRETAALENLRGLAQSLVETRNDGGSTRMRALAEELQAALEKFRRLAGATLDQAEREIRQSHERAGRLRLSPAAALFDFLERAARDAAQTLAKKVRFEATGGGHRLDAPVFSAVQEAFLHIVRNAVAHGLEDPETRLSAGKPPEGRIQLEVKRQGGLISFYCRDDGRGIDPDAVRRAAASKGLPAGAPDAFGMEDAVRLLLAGGLSTSDRLTEIAGRGVGLDVVRETAERLRGQVRIESARGRGTTVELHVPYSLSAFQALAVESGGVTCLIPFDGVRRALMLSARDVAHSPEGDKLLFEDKAAPYLPLRKLFHPDAMDEARAAVVVKAPAGVAALGVDKILGVREMTARPLPALAPADETVASASLDADGNACLVLDPAGLVRAAQNRPGAAPVAAAAPRPPVLVIDDSLTTRMLEQSILESAGYPVETAVSGEEGLLKARQKRYGLILVDVEMPGMNGFQFLEKIREEEVLRDVPSILVSSRSSPEDKKRGEAAGARDYIVKGEFDQVRLLARIRELAG